MPSAETLIEVKGLGKTFNGLRAVEAISFSVRRGEILGLLGPNGAGKTTTLQMLLGLTTPSRGTIRIFGLDLSRHRRDILRRVNFSSAYIALPTNLSVWENLIVFAKLYGLSNPRKRIDSMLETFELENEKHVLTGTLSSGQLTRLNLCKAFLNEPEILFLDEPTASLDPDFADKVRSRLRQLHRRKGVTLIYTSHNMQEVQSLCQRLIFLAQGRIVARGKTEDIVQQAEAASLEDYFISLSRSDNRTAGRHGRADGSTTDRS